MHSSPSTVEISQALARFQNSCTGAVKDGTNPAFKSKYASLDAIWSAIREPLTANGLSVTQMGDWQDGTELLVTTIWHVSGEWISGVQPVYAEQTTRNQHQAHGSAMTYLRRYALAAALGIASQDDDDAESAVAPSEKYRKVPEKYQKVPPTDKTPPAPSEQQQVKNFVDHVCNMEPTGQMIGDACKRVGADSLETVPADKRRDVIADISNQLSHAIGG
jgi:hypothetical protein